MKPHLINKTWIDLDHITSIGPLEYDTSSSIGMCCSITLLFSGPYNLQILVWKHEDFKTAVDKGRAEYKKFVEAWLTK